MKYPMNFVANSSSKSGTGTLWETSASDIQSTLAIPPEFAGPGGGLSPEDLFNQALSNCFVATFKVYAEMSKLSYASVTAASRLTVDLDESKKPVMKTLDVEVTIASPSDAEKARFLAQKAARSGFILNSVKTDCRFHIQIT
jgi:organic hydroperoxide reductase OsmC/OhrA